MMTIVVVIIIILLLLSSFYVSGRSYWENYQNIFWDEKLNLVPTLQRLAVTGFEAEIVISCQEFIFPEDKCTTGPPGSLLISSIFVAVSVVSFVYNYRPW